MSPCTQFCKFESICCEGDKLNCVKVDLKIELYCGNLNLLHCGPMLQLLISDMFVKPRAVQCSCPSDMFELLDQAPPIPVQLSKSQQAA